MAKTTKVTGEIRRNSVRYLHCPHCDSLEVMGVGAPTYKCMKCEKRFTVL